VTHHSVSSDRSEETHFRVFFICSFIKFQYSDPHESVSMAIAL
jgi:hypothetical protein